MSGNMKLCLLSNREGKRVSCLFGLAPPFGERSGCLPCSPRQCNPYKCCAWLWKISGYSGYVSGTPQPSHYPGLLSHRCTWQREHRGLTHKNIGSRVTEVSFSLWFAAVQPSSLETIHGSSAQERRPRSTNDLIRLRQRAVVGEFSSSQR